MLSQENPSLYISFCLRIPWWILLLESLIFRTSLFNSKINCIKLYHSSRTKDLRNTSKLNFCSYKSVHCYTFCYYLPQKKIQRFYLTQLKFSNYLKKNLKPDYIIVESEMKSASAIMNYSVITYPSYSLFQTIIINK